MPNYATKSDLNNATLIKNIYSIQTADASNLVKKRLQHTTKESEKKVADHNHRNRYITTQEFKLTSENTAARLAKANLASKNDIADFIKRTDFGDKLKNLNKKLTSHKRRL